MVGFSRLFVSFLLIAAPLSGAQATPIVSFELELRLDAYEFEDLLIYPYPYDPYNHPIRPIPEEGRRGVSIDDPDLALTPMPNIFGIDLGETLTLSVTAPLGRWEGWSSQSWELPKPRCEITNFQCFYHERMYHSAYTYLDHFYLYGSEEFGIWGEYDVGSKVTGHWAIEYKYSDYSTDTFHADWGMSYFEFTVVNSKLPHVPLPAAMSLSLTALLGLFGTQWFRRRRGRAA